MLEPAERGGLSVGTCNQPHGTPQLGPNGVVDRACRRYVTEWEADE